MTEELPKDLQEAQDKIDNWRKEQGLKNQIGKYFSVMRNQNSSDSILRRIYLDKNDNVRVDEYKSNGYHNRDFTFEFKSWIITEEIRGWDGNDHWNELEGRYFYQNLEKMLNIPQFNTVLKEKP